MKTFISNPPFQQTLHQVDRVITCFLIHILKTFKEKEAISCILAAPTNKAPSSLLSKKHFHPFISDSLYCLFTVE